MSHIFDTNGVCSVSWRPKIECHIGLDARGASVVFCEDIAFFIGGREVENCRRPDFPGQRREGESLVLLGLK